MYACAYENKVRASPRPQLKQRIDSYVCASTCVGNWVPKRIECYADFTLALTYGYALRMSMDTGSITCMYPQHELL